MRGARLGSRARAPGLLTRELLSRAEELGAESDLGAGVDAGTPPRPRQEASWDAGHLPFLIPSLASELSPRTLTLSPDSPPLIAPARRARQLCVPGQQWPRLSL